MDCNRRETMVTAPSINAIAGDKVTAFAPISIGIPYFKGKDRLFSAMEVCKQLFDLSKLFERSDTIEIVARSFYAQAVRGIICRAKENTALSLTPEMVLQDTLDTCLIIAKRGKGTADEQHKFSELQKRHPVAR